MGKRWQNSSNGPDWTDVLVFMRALEELHSVSVVMALSPGAFNGPCGMLTISARKVDQDASVLGSYVAVLSGEYPCKDHKSLEDCAFAGLYRLDSQLSGKVWKQISLPGTGE